MIFELWTLSRAWETSQTLPSYMFGSAPYLKITGILIALTEVLESNNKPRLAYELMSGYLENLPPREAGTEHTWSGPERMRLVAIAFKLAEMANTYSRPDFEERQWLLWSFHELLDALTQDKAAGGRVLDVAPALHELELPDWVAKTDIVAGLEALGEFLARKGEAE
jgi:hypothetical protein